MTNSDKVKLMKGERDDRLTLFQYFVEKLQSGLALDESELPMFEFLRDDLLLIPKVIPGEMSVNITARGGVIV